MFGRLFKPAPEPEPSPFPELQAQVGTRFRLRRRLGGDGQQDLLVAENQAGQLVAVRIWRQAEDGYRDQIRQAVKAQQRIHHSSAAPWRDCGEGRSLIWTSRDYLAGPNLEERLQTGPPPLQEALAWLGQIAAGLRSAHSLGVVHANWKPENLIFHDDRIVLTDFYPSRLPDISSPAPMEHDLGMLYLAPEQVQGVGPPEACSDLYALGVVAFELLTGAHPFGPCSEGIVSVIVKTLSEPAPRVDQLRPELPSHLGDLVAILLSKDPATRRGLLAMNLVEALGGEPLLSPDDSSSPEMRDYLQDMALEGSSRQPGEFTLDTRKALEKLRLHQFAQPHHYLIPLLAAAACLPAERLQISASRQEIQLDYACAPLSEATLQSLFSHAFSSHSSAPGYLAMGVAGALGLASPRVEIVSGRFGATLTRLEEPSLKPANGHGLSLKIKHPAPPAQPPADLKELFRHAAVPMFWNGAQLNCHPWPEPLTEAQVGSEVFSICAALPGSDPGLHLYVDGMSFQLEKSFGFLDAQVVLIGPWRLDVSHRQAVPGAALEPLRQQALSLLVGLAESLALEGPIDLGRVALYEELLTLWKQNGQEEKSDALHSRIVETFSEPDHDLYHPLLERSCYYVRYRLLPAVPLATGILTRPAFLHRLTSWSHARELAQEAFPGKSERGQERYWRFLLQAWLEVEAVTPPRQEIPLLLPRLAVFSDAERRSWDRAVLERIQTLPTSAETLGRCESWASMLPAGFPHTQAWLDEGHVEL